MSVTEDKLTVISGHQQSLPENGQPGDLVINNRRITLYCLLISLSGLTMGFEVGTADNLINNPLFTERFGSFNDLVTGFIISSFNLGALVGTSLGIFLYRYKYDNIVKMAYCIYFTGIIFNLINFIDSIGLFIVYRIFQGISSGIFLLICPIYMIKLNLDNSKRGSNLSLFQLNICLGILFGSGLNLALNPFILQFVINGSIVLVGVLSFFLLPTVIEQETNLEEIKRFYINWDGETELGNQMETISRFKWKKLGYCISLMIFQQLTGINFFFYYANALFPNAASILFLAVTNILGSLASFKVIEWLKRKMVLRLGSGLITGLLLSFWLSESYIVIYFVIFVFATTWGPVSNIVMNEFANANINIIALSIIGNFLFNFLIVNMTPLLLRILKLNILLIFMVSMVCLFIVLYFIPETKELSLSQIEQLF